MTGLDLDELIALAQAATGVSGLNLANGIAFDEVCTPATIIALVERVREAEAHEHCDFAEGFEDRALIAEARVQDLEAVVVLKNQWVRSYATLNAGIRALADEWNRRITIRDYSAELLALLDDETPEAGTVTLMLCQSCGEQIGAAFHGDTLNLSQLPKLRHPMDKP